MKKTKFISFGLLLCLFSLFFYFESCADDEGGSGSSSRRNVTINLNLDNSVLACDKAFVGDKWATISITILEYNANTGSYVSKGTREIDAGGNKWQDANISQVFSISTASSKVIVQVFQDCSYCSDIYSPFCSSPAGVYKDANPYFYGEKTLSDNENNFTVYIHLQQIDCRGC